eukprot:CAMPEP_0206619836 /NCGR_PEP_ID=MMETSP0325_2-20121206/61126_1 /ASSEMBLY_ACC=CAM_ASM_000347 /TAXON_ID=2866 /ORGANISM="Crypthecodinium cohnii, Strain Seligo" /LENGTH=258 /DNA_ID=CAMNT_0054142403 /DNA_START=183 /DNA_END=955 /DNA_ORIENTATION=-
MVPKEAEPREDDGEDVCWTPPADIDLNALRFQVRSPPSMRSLQELTEEWLQRKEAGGKFGSSMPSTCSAGSSRKHTSSGGGGGAEIRYDRHMLLCMRPEPVKGSFPVEADLPIAAAFTFEASPDRHHPPHREKQPKPSGFDLFVPEAAAAASLPSPWLVGGPSTADAMVGPADRQAWDAFGGSSKVVSPPIGPSAPFGEVRTGQVGHHDLWAGPSLPFWNPDLNEVGVSTDVGSPDESSYGAETPLREVPDGCAEEKM